MFLSLHYFLEMFSLFWDFPLYEASSYSDESENEGNFETSEERTKSEESKNISGSRKKRKK